MFFFKVFLVLCEKLVEGGQIFWEGEKVDKGLCVAQATDTSCAHQEAAKLFEVTKPASDVVKALGCNFCGTVPERSYRHYILTNWNFLDLPVLTELGRAISVTAAVVVASASCRVAWTTRKRVALHNTHRSRLCIYLKFTL